MIQHDDLFPRVEGVERCDAGTAGRDSASVLVIIPTYNERGNVTRLMETISALDPHVSFDALIVDDGSTDGTRESVREYGTTADHGVYLMSRKEKFGLGNAYLDAYRWMFKYLPEYKTVVHMDADFSHDPHMIPLLISQARAYGVAVGSRYVVGGCTPDWNWRRVLISLFGNIYMRFVLKLFFPSYPVRDNTAGFIAWKRQVLFDVAQYDIPGDGYSFLTAEKLIAFRVGFPAIEVPIVFRDRRLGVSKISKSIIIEALSMPWRLAMKFRHITFSSSLLPPSDGDPENKPEARSQKPEAKIVLNFGYWLIIPFIFAFLLYLAFILPGLFNGFHPWWRIPVLAPVAPDVYLYQTWLGAVAQGLPQGQFFYWVVPIFRFLWQLTGGMLSLPEFTLLTFILSAIPTVFILPWTIKQWAADLALAERRILTIGFVCVWTLVLGFRPGYYSWYAPVIFFGFGALGLFRRRLCEKRWARSLCWGVLSLAAFFIYPWCLIFAGTFMAVMFARLFFRQSKKAALVSIIIFSIASVFAVFVSLLFAHIVSSPSFAAVIDLYHRTGVTPSHMPFIMNTVLVMAGWLLLGSGFAKDEEGAGHLVGWICLFLLWFDYPFTGFFIYNEHFMQVLAPFGLLSLGYVLSRGNEKQKWSVPVFVVSMLFICLYVWKSFVSSSSVRGFMVHFINWIPLAIAAGLMVFSKRKKIIMMIGVIGLICIGAWGYVSIVRAQTRDVGVVVRTAPSSIIDWIRQDGSAATRYCSDTNTASVLGAHTGRAFYPSTAMMFERVTNEVLRARFRSIAQVFDVDGAGEHEAWNFILTSSIQSTCDAFPFQEKMMRAVGFSQNTIDRVTGCPRQEISAEKDFVSSAITRQGTALPLLSVCDRVIVRDDLQSFWNLPKTDEMLTEVGGYRVYAVH
ncbi:MAG: polyprenol monophosphomannose synthase [Patescibacteria group bacterium]